MNRQASFFNRPTGATVRAVFSPGLYWLRPSRAAYILLALCVLLLCPAAAFLTLYIYFAADMPPAETFGRVQLAQTSRIYDRRGNLLYEALDPESGHRTLVIPEQLPQVVKQATIATEDPSFYSNPGIEPVAVLRAIYYDVRAGELVSGGSTITQQLIKNTLLSPEQTIQRKVQEAILSLEITRRYSKDRILASYLNTVFYGNYAYGIQAAARAYFEKDVSRLDLAEASLLAGLPQAPATYDPCENADAALDRQRIVLALMEKQRFIDSSQSGQAALETTALLRGSDFARRCESMVDIRVHLKAPHFVDYVRQQLEQRYGPEVMYKGGLQVTTTLDPDIQSIVEEEAKKQIASLRGKNVTNAAAVVLDPQSGAIIAMLGSVDFFDASISGQVNVADRPRQPGSSIKPLTYVTALARGWTAATPIYDLRTDFPQGGGSPYVPHDYDGRERGLVSARIALASSLNIPAVKALYLTSTRTPDGSYRPDAMIQTARRLGITTLTGAGGQPGAPYGLALTLGGGEVKLVELTDAFVAFANAGARMPANPLIRVVDGRGYLVYDVNGREKPRPVCAGFAPEAQNEQPDRQGRCPRSAPYAYLITGILSDDSARAPAFGTNSVLRLSRPAAVKTGTTDDFHDNWTVGYTPDLVVGVWVGNANNSPMQGVSGVTGAAPLWHNIVERVLAGKPPRDFPMPSGITRATICIDSGLLATEFCPASRRREEVFVTGHQPTARDTVWQQVRCGGATLTYQVPPRDVADLIPYSRILAWAAATGWRVPPNGQVACGPAH